MLNCMNCFICSSDNLTKFLDLGMHPPPLNFVTKEQFGKKDQLFPLEVFFCNSCGLIQSGTAVDPNLMFIDYVYTSGISLDFKNHLESFAKHLVDKFNLNSNDLVIDVACNDGTLLSFFSDCGTKILGVDPSSVAKTAMESGIPIKNDFFNESTANEILLNNGKSKVITATNVFAHVKELDSFMKGIKLLLEDDGVFVSESQYLMHILEKLEYDTIYHEHLRYYGLKQLVKLFELYGMEVFDAEILHAQGGSIRVYAGFKDKYPISDSVNDILQEEEKKNLHSLDTWKKFAERVLENKEKLLSLLADLKSQNKKIVGISAPGRSTTILNYCNISSELLDYVTEKSNLKIGKYTPGTHIEVVDDEKLVEDQPDYGLLLSWHLADSIIPKIRKSGFKGKIIVNLPEPKIL